MYTGRNKLNARANITSLPKESDEQIALFEWAEVLKRKWPSLEYMYHIPNGGSRNAIEACNLKKQGVKPGIPDIFLPDARGGAFGLYIEMKRIAGGVVSDYQAEAIKNLRKQGYYADVCDGFQKAADLIEWYMSLPPTAVQNDFCEINKREPFFG